MAEEMKGAPELKVRYSDEELQEFKAIILEMLEKAVARVWTASSMELHTHTPHSPRRKRPRRASGLQPTCARLYMATSGS